jgi:hypothetical protein
VYKLEGRKEGIDLYCTNFANETTNHTCHGSWKTRGERERERGVMLRATNWADHFWVSAAATTTNFH